MQTFKVMRGMKRGHYRERERERERERKEGRRGWHTLPFESRFDKQNLVVILTFRDYVEV